MKLGKSPQGNKKNDSHSRAGSTLDMAEDVDAEVVVNERP